jgi:hypothetical protein
VTYAGAIADGVAGLVAAAVVLVVCTAVVVVLLAAGVAFIIECRFCDDGFGENCAPVPAEVAVLSDRCVGVGIGEVEGIDDVPATCVAVGNAVDESRVPDAERPDDV